MIVFDNVRHTIKFIVCARPEQFDTPRKAYDDAVARIDALAAKLRKPVVLPEEPGKTVRHAAPERQYEPR